MSPLSSGSVNRSDDSALKISLFFIKFCFWKFRGLEFYCWSRWKRKLFTYVLCFLPIFTFVITNKRPCVSGGVLNVVLSLTLITVFLPFPILLLNVTALAPLAQWHYVFFNCHSQIFTTSKSRFKQWCEFDLCLIEPCSLSKEIKKFIS